QLNTGRPRLGPDDTRWGVSNWSDVPNEPLYPFGFGLSYTTFEYSEIDLDRTVISFDGAINARVTIRNSGKYKGEETVQMYIHDKIASVSRPVKELKGFKKIELGPGESKTISFKITPEMLKYWNAQLEWAADEGEFDLYVGPNSRDLKKAIFVLEK
ncbi:MAG: fibronectin type III-like domain-contianing protein, partial [Cytophagales bacterium]|nr:fibronectin type III-like domain-contianing protein [Cytophagales bacterium]